MENLAGMIVFARVVEAQSFSEAGRKLGMSPSVVSKHIARLERSLGTRLLNRTTRKLSLTEVGEAVYEHCTRIAHEAEEVEFAVAHLQAKPRGRLRVSAPWTFGMLHMGPVIAAFLRRYPEVEVDLTCRDSVAVDLVEDGLDAAMVLAPAASENVVARQLAPIRWVLCASPDYLAKHGEPESLEDLSRCNCIVYPQLQQAGAWRFRRGDETFTVPARGSFRVNSSLTIRDAVLAGLGLGVLPTFIAGPDLRSGALRSVLREYRPFEESALLITYLPGRPPAPKLRAFIDHCAEAFGPTPFWDEGVDGTAAATP
jgi:DNA-binding transcriptional LysR family regulator